jgi:hypothetical protein
MNKTLDGTGSDWQNFIQLPLYSNLLHLALEIQPLYGDK